MSIEQIRKGLLKSLPPKNEKHALHQEIEICKSLVEKRVDSFINEIIVPLQENGELEMNGARLRAETVGLVTKYYEIYCEGTLSLRTNFEQLNILGTTKAEIDVLTNFLGSKSITELCNYGGNYLADCYSCIISWYRDQLISERREQVYSVSPPLEWVRLIDLSNDGLPIEIKLLLTRIKLIGSMRL